MYLGGLTGCLMKSQLPVRAIVATQMLLSAIYCLLEREEKSLLKVKFGNWEIHCSAFELWTDSTSKTDLQHFKFNLRSTTLNTFVYRRAWRSPAAALMPTTTNQSDETIGLPINHQWLVSIKTHSECAEANFMQKKQSIAYVWVRLLFIDLLHALWQAKNEELWSQTEELSE